MSGNSVEEDVVDLRAERDQVFAEWQWLEEFQVDCGMPATIDARALIANLAKTLVTAQMSSEAVGVEP